MFVEGSECGDGEGRAGGGLVVAAIDRTQIGSFSL